MAIMMLNVKGNESTYLLTTIKFLPSMNAATEAIIPRDTSGPSSETCLWLDTTHRLLSFY